MKKLKGLKLKQLSLAVRAGRLLPVEQVGRRLQDVRRALGMSQRQLAKRLGINQPQLSRIEDDASSCALKTVARIAGALGCEFLGALGANRPLEALLEEQAAKKARSLVGRTFANMALEKQSPGRRSYEYQLKKMTAELAANPGPELWEE